MVRLLLLLIFLATPAAAQDSLRIVLPEGARPVVGEMIRIKIRGEYTGFVALEEMKFPDSPAYDWMQLLPDDWRQERVNGLSRQIFEREIAVFPRQPGNLVIGPVTHHLTKADGAKRSEVAVAAPSVAIPITPYPAPGLPLAARNLKVTDELSGDPARIRDNETIQRRITITAENTMAHFLPPRPDLREKWLISFTSPEIRETRLTEKGPLAYVQWEWSLRPITGEQGTLPPMRFAWFDLAKRELRGAITPPIVFGYGHVGANVGGAAKLPGSWLGIAAVLIGLVFAVVLALRGQGFAGPDWRRWLPNPHGAALRRAAAGTDLMALRRAAQDYAGHARRVGRTVDPVALQRLDRAIFSTEGGDLDRRLFLRDMMRG
ncbi:BatD family protein [Paracoccus laeviglucosivorans]|uniref:Oxygen tolerance n=1 Tax=Paracoccus laeviglucosivorans TaxID=1197861 RepID=A0A521B856_9RHOB|nr:BatD family protein [Paracoccus laeviglucosivorans]SMO43225.1 Oxygen tolerance [Paracoccus laeviglucosivorans]